MSESRRLARSLVEPEAVSMESHYARAESIQRLRDATAAFRTELDAERVAIAADNARFEGRWAGDGEGVRLEGAFMPRAATRVALQVMSMVMLALMATSAWLVFMTTAEASGSARFLVPLFTGLAILGLPFVFMGMASVAEGDRSRIRKAIRVALLDEESRYRRWEKD